MDGVQWNCVCVRGDGSGGAGGDDEGGEEINRLIVGNV